MYMIVLLYTSTYMQVALAFNSKTVQYYIIQCTTISTAKYNFDYNTQSTTLIQHKIATMSRTQNTRFIAITALCHEHFYSNIIK